MVLVSVVILTGLNGGVNNRNSDFFLRVRISLSVIVMPLAGASLVRGFRWVGRYFLWYGLSSYEHQLVTHRVWPTTLGEITFGVCAILLSFWWMLPLLGVAMMLIMAIDNGGNEPHQANPWLVSMMTYTAVFTIFAGYVVGCKETGWYGAFPPDRGHPDAMYNVLPSVV